VAIFIKIENDMTDKEKEEFSAYVEDFLKKVEGNKKMARDFLIRAGIYTKKGKLATPYQHLYLPRN